MSLAVTKPAIILSLRDRVLETAILRYDLTIDLLAGRRQIMADLDQELRKVLPYRPIDRRIYTALSLLEHETVSYAEASRRVFGTGRYANKIRNWYNKIMGGSQ